MTTTMSRREAITTISAVLALFSLKVPIKAKSVDAVASATKSDSFTINPDANVLITCVSFHHQNTLKIANAISSVMNVQMIHPDHFLSVDLTKYKIIGFGSGIYSQTFHRSMLNLADKLTNVKKYKAFLFSTSAISRAYALKHKTTDFHTPMRNKLLSKGFEILGEYNCVGWNTNSFMKFFGGMNKGKPNEDDFKNAREFAAKLFERI